MENRGWVADAFFERPGSPFGDHFRSKIKKWYPKKHSKINAEKVSKNDTKRLQNDAKMDAKINDFSCFFEKGEK